MKVQFAGIELTNPVIAASGTFGYGIEFEEIVSLERIGAFVTKGISLEPMAGHPAPRIIQTAAGMLNAIGLQNIGVAEFIEKKLHCAVIPPARSLSTSSDIPSAITSRSSNASTTLMASQRTS
jgi:dihydroorotate dehydrogenase (NAD+) catalytic subunit